MRSIKQLERVALAAHQRGESWVGLWPSIADDVRQCEPYDRRRYHRLVAKLMSLCLSGDEGPKPYDSLPWLADDEASKPSDTATEARLQVQLPPIG